MLFTFLLPRLSILSFWLFLAVAVTHIRDMWEVAPVETTVPTQDHRVRAKWAKEKGEVCFASSRCIVLPHRRFKFHSTHKILSSYCMLVK
ncbi:hypothetical protein EDC04DRAFT_2755761, partial [Pisolithus marmoratus]